MNELMQNIFDKWKEVSRTYSELVSFEVNYTSIVDEFMKLLKTWGVPYKVVHNEFRISFVLINYNDFIVHKEYYSDNGVTEEILEEYYA